MSQRKAEMLACTFIIWTKYLPEGYEESAYEQYESEKNLMNLRNKVYQYHQIEIGDKATWMAVVSLYFGIDDLRWFLCSLGTLENM